MTDKFIGFDMPEQNINFFELLRDQKPYLSLYHDCRVEELGYKENEEFHVDLVKVFDSGYGPTLGSKVRLSCKHAIVYAISATVDGNFEDVDEIIYIGDEGVMVNIKLVVSGVEFFIKCEQVELANLST